MRFSSSLLLILAAITATNAASVDESAEKPILTRSAVADVSVTDTVKANVGNSDLAHLDKLAVVSARRRGLAHGAALDAVHADVGKVELKHAASIVHTLSASLEGQSKEANSILKIKDHKHAVKKTHKLLHSIRADLKHAVKDIHNLTGKDAAVSVEDLQQRALLGLLDIDLAAVVKAIDGKQLPGATSLISLLAHINVDAVLQHDVLSVLSELNVLLAIHDVVDIATVLTAVLAVPGSVYLFDHLKQLENPGEFVDSLADIKDLNALVDAAHGGPDSLSEIEGSANLIAYAKKYGYTSIDAILDFAGIPCVLEAVKKIPGSVQLLNSLKSVVDVPALVSGINVLGVTDFVDSIKAVDDVEALVSVVVSITGGVLRKRAELLSGVDSTVSGLTSGLGLSEILKRTELLDGVQVTVSGLTSDLGLNKILKRDVLNGVDATVSGLTTSLGLQRVLSLKRALAHISALPNSQVASIEVVNKKRALPHDVGVEAAVVGINVTPAKLLKQRRDLLDNVDLSVLDNLDVAQIVSLKRDIADLSVLNTKAVDEVLEAVVKRAIVESAIGTVDATTGFATGTVGGVLDTVKRDTASDLLGGKGNAGKLANTNGLLTDISAVGNGAIGHPDGHISLSDLNRLISIKRSGILSTVDASVESIDLAQVLPGLKRTIAAADERVTPIQRVNYTPIFERSSDKALLTDSIDTLTVSISALLPKLVKIVAVIDVELVTKTVKSDVIPLVALVASALDKLVNIQAPELQTKLHAIVKVADKSVKSLA